MSAPVAAFETLVWALLIATSQAFTSSSVPRVSIDEFLSSPKFDRPILIRGIASAAALEKMVNDLIDACGDKLVSLQHKYKQKSELRTDIYHDVTLKQSIDYVMDSKHENSYFAFCEGLLSPNEASSKKLNQAMEQIRDKPFLNTENWFDFFPPHLKPTDAIILAGAGSTSTLHRDPFEWTGTSLCLEGTKIWRFIYPPVEGGVSVVDAALNSYRLDSVAWEVDGDESVLLSAGWQSDLSLYASMDEHFPTAIEWMKREEEDVTLFRDELEEMAYMLSPDTNTLSVLQKNSGITNEAMFATAIQQAGDLLIIPAHCWHQTYAPVPSVAVASQRCSASVDGGNVVRHILGLSKFTSELPDILEQTEFVEGSGREVVDVLLKLALQK